MSLGGLSSKLHAIKTLKDSEYVQRIKEYHFTQRIQDVTRRFTHGSPDADYGHVQTRKSRAQLIRLSAAVCGIELCYAAETAFVSPILLKLGVPVAFMTLVWCLSPLLGLFCVPIMGSLSDRCPLRFGRRRPFILLFSTGIVCGLVLVPNGKTLGLLAGDAAANIQPEHQNITILRKINDTDNLVRFENGTSAILRSSFSPEWPSPSKLPEKHIIGILLTVLGVALLDFNCDACQSPCRTYLLDISVPEDHPRGLTSFTVMAGLGGSFGYLMGGINWESTSFGTALGGHVRVVFTGVLLMFIWFVILTITSFKEVPLKDIGKTSEEAQYSVKKVKKSKYKKFVNESSDEESGTSECEHVKETAVSYGSLNDPIRQPIKNGSNGLVQTNGTNGTYGNNSINGTNGIQRTNGTNGMHGTSGTNDTYDNNGIEGTNGVNGTGLLVNGTLGTNGTCDRSGSGHIETNDNGIATQDYDYSKQFLAPEEDTTNVDISLKMYLRSIVKMPRSLLVLCVTNLFCWMSLVCYSLYFTDFVGQSVYGGDPQAPSGSIKHELYDAGVRLGCMGMSLYSLSCALYSMSVEYLVNKFGARTVYVCGQLVYTVGMVAMAISRHPVAVILLSPSAGIMYATLFTMPYLLVANYHSSGRFSQSVQQKSPVIRGLGTDIAVVSSMVFLAQFLLSLFMGSLVNLVGSTVTIVIAASILSLFGAISATQVTYLDL